MNLITKFKNLWQAETAEKIPAKLAQDVAWYDDLHLYSAKDFPKYNTDNLIGRKGYAVYSEMMHDEQVKAVTIFKRNAITARDYDFEFSKETELSEEEQDFRIRLFKQIVKNIPGAFTDKLNSIESAIYNGCSYQEKVFDFIQYEGKQWIGVRELKQKPYHTFEFYLDEYGNVLKVSQEVQGKSIDIDLNKLIHYVHNPDVDEHYGQSELRAAYRSWFSKDNAIKFNNIFLSRMASGFIWASPKDGYALSSSDSSYTQLQNVLTNIQAKTGIILPAGIELHVEKPNDTKAFEASLQYHDKGIAKALLIPNLLGISEQGDVGSYSQSQTQLEAFFWTLDSDVNRLEETLNEQLFEELGDLNFGDGDYPKFKFKPLSLFVAIELAKTFLTFTTGGQIGFTEQDEDHVRNLLGFPERIEDAESEENEIEEKEDDETLMGNGYLVTTAAFNKALNRVNFIEIDRSVEKITVSKGLSLGDIVASGVEEILVEFNIKGLSSKDVSKLNLKSSSKKDIQTNIKEALVSGWGIGKVNAEVELQKAERLTDEEFSTKINMTALADEAAKYFDAQSFNLTGDVSDKVDRIIKTSVMNGIKYSKSTAEVKADIYQKLASAGLISTSAAEMELGALLDTANPDHMLNTIIRTGTFEAINEARHNYFTDAALDGFVVAYQYSSILDSRTTAICNELGGSDGTPHTHSVDWPGWDKYRPPNHYNCRSLLIPITKMDEYEETSSEPVNQPLEGFA